MSDPIDITDSTLPEQWIPEDLTGTLTTNFFRESHPVSACVTSGASGKTIIISPYRGAFYGSDDLTVTYTYGGTTTVLSRADYRFIGMDIGRTRASSSRFGVYRFIQMTYDTSSINDNGTIVLVYHAFGGQLDRYAYQRLVDMINAIDVSGGTSGSGDVTRAEFTALSDKVGVLSTRLNYNDVESPTVSRAVEGGWSPIAYSSSELDDYIDFSDASTLTGTGSFVLVSQNLHGTYNFSYEIYKVGSTYKCNLNCDVQNQKITPFSTDNESYFTSGMVVPMFRLTVDTSVSPAHKLVLMMALVSNSSASYDIYIGDKTDVVLTSGTPTVDGQIFDAWEVGSCTAPSTYVNSNVVLGLQDYYKIWEGNANLAFIEDVSWEGISINGKWNEQNSLIPDKTANGFTVWPFIKGRFDINAIKSMRVDVYDRVEDRLITATGLTTIGKPYGNASDQTVYACLNYFPFDNCLLELFYKYDGRSIIKLYSSSGSSSYLNQRFDLRAIYIK